MFQATDADAIFKLATELAASGIAEGSEIKLRSAVSRAYYAVFLLAQQKTRVTDVEKVHAAVIYQVSRQKGIMLSDRLRELKTYRESADYGFPPQKEHRDWNKNWEEVNLKAQSLLNRFKAW